MIAADGELRLLLRGLLQLFHHRVVREGATLQDVPDSGSEPEPMLLLVAVAAGDEHWKGELARVHRSRPGIRSLVVLPPVHGSVRGSATEPGAGKTLVRPIAVRELEEALEELRRDSAPSLVGGTGIVSRSSA